MKVTRLAIGKFSLAYVLGIGSAILLTPAEIVLAGKNLLYYYLTLSPLGFYFFMIDPIAIYLTEFSLVRILGYVIGFTLIVAVASYFMKPVHALQKCTPAIIGFSLGFVGTFGMYYLAASGI